MIIRLENSKRTLVWVVVILLVITMSIVAAADTSEPLIDAATWDASIFEKPDSLYDDYDICECLDGLLLNIRHYEKDGIYYFHWIGEEDKMLSKIEGTCFGGAPAYAPTVVFLDGVPNLVNDLFKYWENGTKDVYIPDSVKEIEENCFVEGSHITIHFTKNNAVALAYAQSRGMAFEVMDGERMLGDVDFDKSVDMKDVLCLRKSIASLPAAVEIYSTDLNADGSTDMKDVLTLRKQIATAAA